MSYQLLGTGTVNFIIQGNGAPISPGIQGDFIIDFNGEIESATLLADQTGDIVVDIWRDSYSNYPPTVADSITGGAKPTLSSAVKYQDLALPGWTTAFSAGDTFRVNVDSTAIVQRVTLSLKVRQ